MKTTIRRSMLPFLSLHHDNKSLKYGCTITFPKKEPNFNKVINSIMFLFTISSAWFDLGLYFIIYLYIYILWVYTPKYIYFKPFSSIILIATFKETTLIDSNNSNGGKVHLQRLLLSCFYKRSNHQVEIWTKRAFEENKFEISSIAIYYCNQIVS